MKISIGADHRGFALKKELIDVFHEHTWFDRGADSSKRSDYPTFAKFVCNDLLDDVVEVGILICGSGIGMSIAANRCRGVYAALCWNEEVAKVARQHDGANVLVLPADFVSLDRAVAMLNVFLTTDFLGERYKQRLIMLDD